MLIVWQMVHETNILGVSFLSCLLVILQGYTSWLEKVRVLFILEHRGGVMKSQKSFLPCSIRITVRNHSGGLPKASA